MIPKCPEREVTVETLTDAQIRELYFARAVQPAVAFDALTTDASRRYPHESDYSFRRRKQLHFAAREICAATINARKAGR